MRKTEHAFVSHRGLRLGLRDLTEHDLAEIVRYWLGGVADLEFLGIDLARLGNEKSLRDRFAATIPTGDREQRHLGFAITCNDVLVGYTNLNQYTPESNYSHWHITDPRQRAGGISSALYPHRIKMYFDATNMARLIHQTRTRNIGVNRMLDKFVPVAETAHVEKPDGLAKRANSTCATCAASTCRGFLRAPRRLCHVLPKSTRQRWLLSKLRRAMTRSLRACPASSSRSRSRRGAHAIGRPGRPRRN